MGCAGYPGFLEPLQKVLREQRNIFLPLTKRRQANRNDVEPVIQVAPKLAVLDHLQQIAVGGRDHADVDLDGVRVADALELALLQHAEELHLQPRAHRADLVEEERAFVRLLDPPLPVAHGARERAAHVAEELGFEQRFGNGRAVERDEPVHAPRAVVMDGARHHFLARTRFARHQHGARRRRHGFEQLKELGHHSALADQALEAIALVELCVQVRVLRFQAPLLERRVEHVEKLVDLERLGDEIPRAAFDGFDGVFHRSVSRDHNRDNLWIELDCRLHEGPAVEARQAKVGDDNVECEVRQTAQGFLARFGLLHVVASIGELLGNGLPQGRLVFNQEEMFYWVRHLGERQ